jgi:molybdopterin converting factor subunit 1
MSKRIRINYFASLREERGVAQEEVTTSAATAAELYEELSRAHRFSLPGSRLRVAINESFVPWSTTLQDGDGLVFIPPVAGG